MFGPDMLMLPMFMPLPGIISPVAFLFAPRNGLGDRGGGGGEEDEGFELDGAELGWELKLGG